jgi:hypothetical protein
LLEGRKDGMTIWTRGDYVPRPGPDGEVVVVWRQWLKSKWFDDPIGDCDTAPCGFCGGLANDLCRVYLGRKWRHVCNRCFDREAIAEDERRRTDPALTDGLDYLLEATAADPEMSTYLELARKRGLLIGEGRPELSPHLIPDEPEGLSECQYCHQPTATEDDETVNIQWVPPFGWPEDMPVPPGFMETLMGWNVRAHHPGCRPDANGS